MSLFDAARHRLRSLFRPGAADRERDEEYAFHQSLAAADHAHDTGDDANARAAARRQFGNTALVKEDVRWTGAMRWVDQFGEDLRFAARTLRRSPVFAIVAVLSIGLGIGANTAVFGVIHALMLERLPVSRPEQLVQLWRADARQASHPYFTVAEYDALRASGVEISLITNASVTRSEIGGISNNRLSFEALDGALFPMLGLRAAAGRLLTPEDERQALPVAVLGYGSAVRYFGSSRDAVGQKIRLQDQMFTIVGVLPRRFRGLHVEWPMTIVVPRTTGPLLRNERNPRDGTELTLVARLGANADEIRTALERGFAACCANGQLSAGRQLYGPELKAGQRLALTDISRGITVGKFDVREMFGRLLYTLMAGVALILLIACTNIGNLLLARATMRARELAVRMSLGASRARIVRQLLAESVLLAAIGAAVGVLLAVWGTALLSERLPGNLRILEHYVALAPNPSLLGFTAGVAVVCTIVFGVLPAIRATRLDPVAGLRAGSPGTTRSNRLDRGLIAFQLALALVLVASAGLLEATLRQLRSGIGDMQPDRLLIADVETAGTSIAPGREGVVFDQVMERLRAVPGVVSVAGADVMPLFFMGFTTRLLEIPGFEHLTSSEKRLDRHPLGAGIIYATPGFFTTTGTGLVAGREFNDRDVAGAPPVAIVSEVIARQFYPDRSAIGERIGFRGGAHGIEIIGVARDVKQTDLRADPPRTVYLSRAQQREDGGDTIIFAIRTERRARAIAPAARAAMAAAAPGLVIRNVQPMSAMVAFMVGREQALEIVAVVFSVVAVGLAAIGLYGVMAFHVTSRSREIGIRMALGADRPRVVRMVVRQSLIVVAAGVAVGVPLAMTAASMLRAHLYGVEPFAPAPFVIAAVVLVAAGLVAALLPSRAASRVDPLIAIRSE
jgi:predicted permease